MTALWIGAAFVLGAFIGCLALFWVIARMGPGEVARREEGRSLVLRGETELHRQLMAAGWFRYTPWMFIDGRQSKPRYRWGAPPLKVESNTYHGVEQ